jgi:hypothetical protein
MTKAAFSQPDPIPASDATLRIPVRPQRWLFVLGLFVHPPLAAMCFWGASDSESLGICLFMVAVGLFVLGLFAFSVLVLSRMRNRRLEIVADAETLEVPMGALGKLVRVPFAAMRSASIMETPTAVTSFWALTVKYADGDRTRALVINSQFVGMEAFEKVCALLTDRGLLRR